MLLPRWLAVVMAGLVVAGCTNKTAVAPFRPESVTFVSADVGLVIGLSTCGNVQCLRLAQPPDGGHTWTWVTGGGLPGLLLGDGCDCDLPTLRTGGSLDHSSSRLTTGAALGHKSRFRALARGPGPWELSRWRMAESLPSSPRVPTRTLTGQLCCSALRSQRTRGQRWGTSRPGQPATRGRSPWLRGPSGRCCIRESCRRTTGSKSTLCSTTAPMAGPGTVACCHVHPSTVASVRCLLRWCGGWRSEEHTSELQSR